MSYGDWSSDVCSSDLIAGAPDFVGEDQQLEQSGAPAIPTSATRCAAAPPCERRRPRFTHQLRGFLVRDIRFAAALAHFAHQPLREHCLERGGDEVWRHPEIEQPRN